MDMSSSLPSKYFPRKSKGTIQEFETGSIKINDFPCKQTSNPDGNSINEHHCSESTATNSSQEITSASQITLRSAILSTAAPPSPTLTLSPSPSNDKQDEAICRATPTDNEEGLTAKRLQSDLCPTVSSSGVFFKLLLPNNIAGIIIGKSGESIAKLQKQCRCRIMLSQPRDFYLGTSDRVCVLQGENYDNIKLAVCLILKKYFYATGDDILATQKAPGSPTKSALGNGRERDFVIRILIPNSACGMIIGKGGSNIKAIASSTSSKIQITQKQDIACLATSERVVTITGNLQACTSCINKMLDIMESYPNISQYSNVTTSYKKSGPIVNAALMDKKPSPTASSKFGPVHTWVIEVPDALIGKLLGRGGSGIKEIQLQSGARIELISNGEYVSGTANRRIAITGTKQVYDSASFLIRQRLSKAQSNH